MTTDLDSIDRRLAQLVEIGRLQQQNMTELAESTDKIVQGIDKIGQGIDKIGQGMEDLKEVTQQQARTATIQAENIRSLVSAVAELARSTTEL